MRRKSRKSGTFTPERICLPAAVTAAVVLSLFFLPEWDLLAESYVRSAAGELGTINSILKTTVQGIGSILLLYYLFDFGSSLHAGENGSLYRSLRGIAGGILFLSAPSVISVLIRD